MGSYVRGPPPPTARLRGVVVTTTTPHGAEACRERRLHQPPQNTAPLLLCEQSGAGGPCTRRDALPVKTREQARRRGGAPAAASPSNLPLVKPSGQAPPRMVVTPLTPVDNTAPHVMHVMHAAPGACGGSRWWASDEKICVSVFRVGFSAGSAMLRAATLRALTLRALTLRAVMLRAATRHRARESLSLPMSPAAREMRAVEGANAGRGAPRRPTNSTLCCVLGRGGGGMPDACQPSLRPRHSATPVRIC